MNKDEKTVMSFVKTVKKFAPTYDTSDLLWEFYLKINRKWHSLVIREYNNVLYLYSEKTQNLEINIVNMNRPDTSMLFQDNIYWLEIFTKELAQMHAQITHDPIDYFKKLSNSLSPGFRKGIIHRKILSILIPEYCDFQNQLTKQEMNRIITLLKNRPSSPVVKKMTAGRFFKYCKVAYLANLETFDNKINPDQTGIKLYKRWADGRDGGLSDLPLSDEEAFKKWYEGGAASGGHPWEIYRGGNSTHISLQVSRSSNKEGWQIHLDAFSSTRLIETCRIALALSRANLPFTLENGDSYLKRLLQEDYVGIVPEGSGIKYAWHYFPKEFNVADCIYYSWFKDDNGKTIRPHTDIKKCISWLPLRPLFVI